MATNRIRDGVFCVAFAALLSSAATAYAIAPIDTNWRGLAIGGYDPVAYFTEGRPVEGTSDFTTEWKGATWRFASVAHRDAFVANPDKYAPQYGGYCAWAVAHDKTAAIDPEAWRIVDGKLYLNYSKDIQKQWEQDVPGYIGKADAIWPRLLGAN
jgi:YHS domain-containing protein